MMRFVSVLVLVLVVGVVIAIFREIGLLSALPLVNEAGAYDIGRANSITHLYLQMIIVLLIGLPGAALVGWLAWRSSKQG